MFLPCYAIRRTQRTVLYFSSTSHFEFRNNRHDDKRAGALNDLYSYQLYLYRPLRTPEVITMSEEEEQHIVESDEAETWNDDEQDEDDSYESSSSTRVSSRSILWLCQEGLMSQARRRFDHLQEQENPTELHRQIFQVGHDGNYALHEILMGGTTDFDSHELVVSILTVAAEQPDNCRIMLKKQPKSHSRTALHWAAWEGNIDVHIMRMLVSHYPEALVLRDKRDKGHRTPIEILQRYYANDRAGEVTDVLTYVEKSTKSWIQHRLRHTIYLAAHRYFVTDPNRKSFDKTHARNGIKPRPWFCLSVLGFLLQREMKPLVKHILEYVGKNAKVKAVKQAASKKKRKRKRT
jgi:hypothetical protein